MSFNEIFFTKEEENANSTKESSLIDQNRGEQLAYIWDQRRLPITKFKLTKDNKKLEKSILTNFFFYLFTNKSSTLILPLKMEYAYYEHTSCLVEEKTKLEIVVLSTSLLFGIVKQRA